MDLVVDANGRPFAEFDHRNYPGKTAVAHINHYVCRSFQNFMRRIERGEAAFTKDNAPAEQQWRFDYEGCLRKFIADSKDMNELVDDYMLRYAEPIQAYMRSLSSQG